MCYTQPTLNPCLNNFHVAFPPEWNVVKHQVEISFGRYLYPQQKLLFTYDVMNVNAIFSVLYIQKGFSSHENVSLSRVVLCVCLYAYMRKYIIKKNMLST